MAVDRFTVGVTAVLGSRQIAPLRFCWLYSNATPRFEVSTRGHVTKYGQPNQEETTYLMLRERPLRSVFEAQDLFLDVRPELRPHISQQIESNLGGALLEAQRDRVNPVGVPLIR